MVVRLVVVRAEVRVVVRRPMSWGGSLGVVGGEEVLPATCRRRRTAGFLYRWLSAGCSELPPLLPLLLAVAGVSEKRAAPFTAPLMPPSCSNRCLSTTSFSMSR